MGKLLTQAKEGKLSENEELVPGEETCSTAQHQVHVSRKEAEPPGSATGEALPWHMSTLQGLDRGPSPPAWQDAALHLQTQIPAVSSSLSHEHSKHLTLLIDKAKNIFIPNLCLPSPSGLRVAVKLRCEATDYVSHWTCSIHLISFLWCKIVITKQEDETFNASQMLRGMQNKCTAKHFQPFSFSISSLYGNNKN